MSDKKSGEYDPLHSVPEAGVTITITVSSPAWINAFEHAHGDADLAIDNVFKTLIVRYEDAKLAGTYGQRNNVYARNGLRKSLWGDYERWTRGELIQ